MDDLFPETLPRSPVTPGARLLVGTSGYSFADWVGPFYPPGLRPSDFLRFYARSFPCVEVNASYYRVPSARAFEQMERKTPAGFRFVVKLHRSMTHDRVLDAATLREFRAALEPLRAAGKHDGLLAQFPWAFRRSPEALDHLESLRQAFPGESLFVEFRHDSWNVPELEPWLRERGLGFVAVDEPRLPGLMPPVAMVTAEDAYVRFHGRNERTWWSRSEPAPAEPGAASGTGAAREATASAPPAWPADREPRRQLLRYDYSYSERELAEWMGRIRELADKARRTYLFFNNCHAGQAARSAKLMQEMLRQQKLAT